ncbi:MAG: Thymidine kinase [uncultured Corynebacteriales bacterium]|uniref:Thymidine kinase n=1 Tax=uncultured Mycobacteriales bacterium TaxID=581187 RepID=A0A6J4H648_9ACTN|nr:MAG: Thymidine kinase [uncultured Corynebacteriales bacterium]
MSGRAAPGGRGVAAVPASGDRRRYPAPAALAFFHGPMDCGKSTLALQIDHNQARQGRCGLLLVRHDRSGPARISSRLGMSRTAIEITDELDLVELVRSRWAAGARVDYLVVDEAQFLAPAQVEALVDLVDDSHVDVYAFGITTDFRGRLFPGSQRLLELADSVEQLQVEVLCWCGRPGRLNARVVGGRVARAGDTVLVADTAAEAPVHYQVLCRAHHRAGDLGPGAPAPGQLTLG